MNQESIRTSEITKDTKAMTGLRVAVGPFGGLGVGIAVGIVFIFIGFLLSLTIIGAIIGIPLIIGGVLTIILGPLLGAVTGAGVAFTARRALCPYCQNAVSIKPYTKGVTCGTCQKRLVVRGKQLSLVE